jgi:hypothetical protein
MKVFPAEQTSNVENLETSAAILFLTLMNILEDVKGMQETVNSIQASLMTSVGLIQGKYCSQPRESTSFISLLLPAGYKSIILDQVSEFSHRLTKQLEAKLVSLDKKMDSLSSSMFGLQVCIGKI